MEQLISSLHVHLKLYHNLQLINLCLCTHPSVRRRNSEGKGVLSESLLSELCDIMYKQFKGITSKKRVENERKKRKRKLHN